MPRALSWLVRATALSAAGVLMAACTGESAPIATPSPSTSVPRESVHTAELVDLYVGNSTAPQDRREGRCFARALEERLDEQSLIAGGIVGGGGAVVSTLPIFDLATAEAWVDAQLACVDYVAASTRALLTQTRGDLDAETYAVCLRTTLTDAEVRAALTQSLSGGFDSPEVTALANAQSTCAS